MAAALIIRDKKILLVHNTKHGLRVEPPGGKKRDEEEWAIAVIREVQEELGVKVRPARLFGEYATHSPEGDFTVRMYLSEIIEGEPRVIEPEIIPDFGWYTYEDLERFASVGILVPNMVEALPKLKKYL